MDDRSRGLARVDDERVAFGEPAHGDLTALALDLLGLDRASLLGDVEESLEEQAPLRPSAREAARLIRSRERVEDGLDRRDAARVLARHGVDPAQHPDQVEDCFRDERRGHVRSEHLLGLRAGASFELREDGALIDARVDALLEDARCFLLRQRNHARDEVAARHRAGVQRHELVEEEHGKSPLLLVRLRRRRWDDGRDMWFSPPAHAHAPAPLRRASWALGRKRRLVHLRVVGPERGAGPARLRDQVFEEEDVVAQVGRVAQLVGE